MRPQRWLVCAFLFFISSNSFADIGAEAGQSVPSITAMLLQVFGTLVFIVVIILGGAWAAKKLKLVNAPSNVGLRALSALTLGRKEKAVLIDAGGKKMLLGVASGSVTLLHVFDEALAPDEIDSHDVSAEYSSNRNTKNSKAFSGFLNSLLVNTGRSDDQ